MKPVFLTLDEIVELHRESIERYGGSLKLRDSSLLQSALAMPAASFGGEYLHPSLPDMAGALLFHLVQNHPFVDGNKRIGAISARVFLLMNDVKFQPPSDEYEALTLGVASGRVTKSATIEFFRKHAAI